MEKKIKNLFNVNKLANLQILTLTSYLVTITSFFYITFSWQLLLLTIILYFLIFGFGVSMTLHRSVNHKSIVMHPILEIIGKFFASMGGTGSPISWHLIHNAHHRYSDTDKDPHAAKDALRMFFGKYPEVDKNGIAKLARLRHNRFMHRYYYLILFFYALVWFFLGLEYFVYGFVYPLTLNILAGHLVNWYTHSSLIGNYRVYNTKDNSNNNIVIGLITWGEGFHNAHHRYPRKANFSTKFYELDITYMFALLLEKCKLLKIVKRI